MQLSAVIARLQQEQAAHGDVEVKLDIDGCDVDPDFYWQGDSTKNPKPVFYLW